MADERPRLRRQLLAWLLAPLFLLLVVDSFVSYWIAADFSRRAYDRSLLEIARELSLHLAGEPAAPRLDLPENARKLLLNDPEDPVRYELRAADGRHLEGDIVPGGASAAPNGRAAFFDTALSDRTEMRAVQLAVPPERPSAVLVVAEPVSKRELLAREILLSVVLPQAILIVVAGLVVWIGVVHGLAPLEELRRAILARRPGDRSALAIAGVPAEVHPLLDSINELMAGLDRALTAQSRFIADAAHQLKTPVTVIKTQLELALREEDPERMRAGLANTRAGIERLARIVSQLLSLARNEPEAAALARLEPTDLGALALDVSREWVPEALKKDIDLGFEPASGPATIRADAARVREMLDNLVDNAVRYTPFGGRVTVRVRSTPKVSVEVSDDGPRIPADERERVFGRFHRLLGSPSQGSGLGLAIAREIARIHGASIELSEDADGVGNSFRVTFPAP